MSQKKRIENALWGLFISDSVSMPAHWYYKRDYLKKEFGVIDGYNDAPHPHPESFMVGNRYHPNVAKAKELGRKYDIIGSHIKFYDTPYSSLDIDITQRAGEHANAMPNLEERYHYHHGLKAGENTLGANLVRVLLRSIISQKSYKQENFLEDFIAYMTSGENRDPYSEIYLRAWFVNYCEGIPAEICAEQQRTVWSIGSHGGAIRPLVLSLLSGNAFTGLGMAIAHQNLTHRSENVSQALGVLVPLLDSLIKGSDSRETISHFAFKVRLVKIKGEELSKTYREHQGPGNIPKDKMWDIHTVFSDENLDLDKLLSTYTDDELMGPVFATACYPEHGLPLLLAILQRNSTGFKESIMANANAGGDNVHRGMLLGMLAGACHDEVDEDLKRALVDYDAIKEEIEAFASLVS
jgi:ADP-ribosyl-[dinitrogen reductase] hydrolase